MKLVYRSVVYVLVYAARCYIVAIYSTVQEKFKFHSMSLPT